MGKKYKRWAMNIMWRQEQKSIKKKKRLYQGDTQRLIEELPMSKLKKKRSNEINYILLDYSPKYKINVYKSIKI